MKLQSTILFYSALNMLIVFSTFAQNVPIIGNAINTQFNVGTGRNYLLFPIDDADINQSQNLTVTAASLSANISIIGTNYVQGSKMATVSFTEKNALGSASITVTCADVDGITQKEFNLNIGNFYAKGNRFKLYDIVFWKYETPVDQQSLLDTIIPFAGTALALPAGSSRGSENAVVVNKTALTVGLSLFAPSAVPAASGTHKGSGYTTKVEGIFVPTITGYYYFQSSRLIDLQDRCAFGIFKDENFTYGTNSNLLGRFRTVEDNKGTDATIVYLEAQKPYAYYAVNWVVFNEFFHISYGYIGTSTASGVSFINAEQANIISPLLTTAGVTRPNPKYNAADLINNIPRVSSLTLTRLEGDVIFPFFDKTPPASPTNLIVVRKGKDQIELKWNTARDIGNRRVKSYTIYKNGIIEKANIFDKDTVIVIKNLIPSTEYSFAVVSVDNAGNTSELSNILNVETYPTETTPPSVPTGVTAALVGDMSAKITWNSSTDTQSGIYGYRIYVDGNLYTPDTLLANEIILKTFQPSTSHTVEIVAIDGSGNASAKSTPISFTTLKYNPETASPGIKKLRMNIGLDFIGKNMGVGINGDWDSPTYYESASIALHQELRPALIRWGGITANVHSYASKSGTGTVSNITYARFLNMAKQLGCYASISVGTDNNPAIDWRSAPAATATKFIEYLNGTSGAESAKRTAEGFSQPLISGLKGLIIELGTEPWGGSNPAGTDHNADGFDSYVTYRRWARPLAVAFKNAPFYDSTNTFIAYSGREPRPEDSYGLTQTMLGKSQGNTMDATDVIDWISLGGYMGGNFNYTPDIDPGKTELDYYKNGIQKVYNNLLGFRSTSDIDLSLWNRNRPYFLYESNMTKSEYAGRFGQALVLADYYLSSMKEGVTFPVVFQMRGGEWGIVEPDGTRLPLFNVAKLINQYTKGEILNTTGSSPEKIYNSTGTLVPHDPVSINAFYENGKYKVVLVSRDFENDFQVQLNLPDGKSFATSGRVYSLTNSDFSSKASYIDSADIAVNDSMIVSVPKHSMKILVFSGPILPNIPLAMGYRTYKKATSFSVISEPDITTENTLSTPASIEFAANIVPASTPFNSVKWTVTTADTIPLEKFEGDNKLTLSFTECFTGEAVNVTVTGTLVDNPNFSETKIISVSPESNINYEPCIASPTKSANGLNAKDIKIFPNPSKGRVMIAGPINSKITLSDATGKVIHTHNLSTETVSFGDLNKGLYIVNVTNASGAVSKKLVVE